MEINKINIAVIDDHQLFRQGIIRVIRSLDDRFNVLLEASNGQDFIRRLPNDHQIKIAIVDLDMEIMDGRELAIILKEKHPEINVLTLTMHGEDEEAIIGMIRSGVKGYLSKDVEPLELKKAIETVASGKFHFNEALSGKLLEIIIVDKMNASNDELNDREMQFVELCCSELTYKEIANEMCLSPKTIDGYRAALFERFELKSRVGLVLFAIKKGWFSV